MFVGRMFVTSGLNPALIQRYDDFEQELSQNEHLHSSESNLMTFFLI